MQVDGEQAMGRNLAAADGMEEGRRLGVRLEKLHHVLQ